MGCSRQRNISFGTRLFAVLAATGWLAAFGFCFIEVAFPHQHENAGHSHDEEHDSAHHDDVDRARHDDADAQHSHDSEKHHGSEDACCNSLITILRNHDALVFQKICFSPIGWVNSLASLEQAFGNPSLQSHIFRQAREREVPFTHGVYLRSANQSHAPPAFC